MLPWDRKAPAERSTSLERLHFIGVSNNNFKHYRWKVYNIVVKPKNLAQ